MRRLIAFIAAAAAVVAIASPSASGRANEIVKVDDDFFTPSPLTIKEGKTVDFEWVGVNDHDIYSQSGPRISNFHPGIHGSGFSYPYKFKKPGKYVLACTLHPEMLMDLKVKKKRRN